MATTLSSPPSGRIVAPVSAAHAFPGGLWSAEARVTVDQLVDQGALWVKRWTIGAWTRSHRLRSSRSADGISPY